MTHFQNNNTPSQAFSHNKESKGRPVYFSFHALHLLEWPELCMQMPDYADLFHYGVIPNENPSSPQELP